MVNNVGSAAPDDRQAYDERMNHLLDVYDSNMERMRATLLLWVDQFERMIGITPRTAELRQWWRDQGEPNIGKGGKRQ